MLEGRLVVKAAPGTAAATLVALDGAISALEKAPGLAGVRTTDLTTTPIPGGCLLAARVGVPRGSTLTAFRALVSRAGCLQLPSGCSKPFTVRWDEQHNTPKGHVDVPVRISGLPLNLEIPDLETAFAEAAQAIGAEMVAGSAHHAVRASGVGITWGTVNAVLRCKAGTSPPDFINLKDTSSGASLGQPARVTICARPLPTLPGKKAAPVQGNKPISPPAQPPPAPQQLGTAASEDPSGAANQKVTPHATPTSVGMDMDTPFAQGMAPPMDRGPALGLGQKAQGMSAGSSAGIQQPMAQTKGMQPFVRSSSGPMAPPSTGLGRGFGASPAASNMASTAGFGGGGCGGGGFRFGGGGGSTLGPSQGVHAPDRFRPAPRPFAFEPHGPGQSGFVSRFSFPGG